MNIYISTYPLPSRSEYLFTLPQSVVQNLSDMWHHTFEIGTAQLRSVTKMATKSLLLQVNRNPIRYDFLAGAIERRSVTSHYHGSNISGWQQNQRRWRRRGERQKENVYNNKQQLCTCITLFCTFLCRRYTTTTWNLLIPRARFMESGQIIVTFFF